MSQSDSKATPPSTGSSDKPLSAPAKALAAQLISHMGYERALEVCKANQWDSVEEAIRERRPAA